MYSLWYIGIAIRSNLLSTRNLHPSCRIDRRCFPIFPPKPCNYIQRETHNKRKLKREEGSLNFELILGQQQQSWSSFKNFDHVAEPCAISIFLQFLDKVYVVHIKFYFIVLRMHVWVQSCQVVYKINSEYICEVCF